jgi:hypothetical protein
MRTLVVAALVAAAYATPLAGQATRDRPTLIFTITGAYLDGIGLWSIPDQPITDNSLVDHYSLRRSVKRTLGAGASGTYYRGAHFGLTAEAFLLGLGYDDECHLAEPVASTINRDVCNSIDERERSAAAVVTSIGAIYRIGADEFISPYARVAGGILINNQSPLLLVGETGNNAEFVIYDDDNSGPRIRPAIAIGLGAAIAVARAYHIRWEVRDNIVGIQRVTAPTTSRGVVPPHETAYKHILSLNVGLDVILEKRRGRRY